MKNNLLTLCAFLFVFAFGVKGQNLFTAYEIASSKLTSTDIPSSSSDAKIYDEHVTFIGKFSLTDNAYKFSGAWDASLDKIPTKYAIKITVDIVNGGLITFVSTINNRDDRGLFNLLFVDSQGSIKELVTTVKISGTENSSYEIPSTMSGTYDIYIGRIDSYSTWKNIKIETNQAGPGTDNILHSLTVNEEIVTVSETMNASIPYSYADPTIPVTFEVDATAKVQIDGVAVTNPTMIDAPEETASHTITVMAEDGNSNYTLIIERMPSTPAMVVGGGSVGRKWDFTVWSETTKSGLTSDTNNWTLSGDYYKNNSGAMADGVLKIGENEIPETQGLVFGELSAANDRVRIFPDYLYLHKNTVTITISNLSAGSLVTVVSSGVVTLTNATPESSIESDGKLTSQFQVETAGSVTLGVTAMLSIYSIAITTGNETPLTSEALSTLTDVKLSGDILSEHVAMLNNANLTSIDVTETSSVASGLNPVNPNCLVYANAALEGVNNVVVDDIAEAITITDGHDFNNIKAFTATTITYDRYLYAGWNTIAFPFLYAVNGEHFEEYNSASESTVVFTEASGSLTVNQAYLINVDVDGDNSFTAKGVLVPVTETVGDVFKSNFCSFVMVDDASLYKLNADGTAFNHSDGGATVGAFRAYLDLSFKQSGANKVSRRIIHGNGGATVIDELSANRLAVYSEAGSLIINAADAQCVQIYSVDGRMVRNVVLESGDNIINGLAKGVYIVGKQKVAL